MRSIATDVAWFDDRSPVSVVSSQEIKLVKSPTEKLGISVRGGVDSLRGNPHDDTDKGIFVSKAQKFCCSCLPLAL